MLFINKANSANERRKRPFCAYEMLYAIYIRSSDFYPLARFSHEKNRFLFCFLSSLVPKTKTKIMMIKCAHTRKPIFIAQSQSWRYRCSIIYLFLFRLCSLADFVLIFLFFSFCEKTRKNCEFISISMDLCCCVLISTFEIWILTLSFNKTYAHSHTNRISPKRNKKWKLFRHLSWIETITKIISSIRMTQSVNQMCC